MTESQENMAPRLTANEEEWLCQMILSATRHRLKGMVKLQDKLGDDFDIERTWRSVLFAWTVFTKLGGDWSEFQELIAEFRYLFGDVPMPRPA